MGWDGYPSIIAYFFLQVGGICGDDQDGFSSLGRYMCTKRMNSQQKGGGNDVPSVFVWAGDVSSHYALDEYVSHVFIILQSSFKS